MTLPARQLRKLKREAGLEVVGPLAHSRGGGFPQICPGARRDLYPRDAERKVRSASNPVAESIASKRLSSTMLLSHLFVALLITSQTVVSFRVVDDVLAPAAGVDILIEQFSPALTAQVATGSHGQSPFVHGLAVGPVQVSLREKGLLDGGLVGVRYLEEIAADPYGSQIHSVVHSMTQPRARRVQFLESPIDSDVVIPSVWPLVRFTIPGGTAGINQTVDVAPLPDSRSITAVLEYYGYPGVESYSRGVYLRSRGGSLGSAGIVVEIDCAGLGFTSAPALDMHLFLDTHDPQVPVAYLTPSFLLWEEEFAYYRIEGALDNGRYVLGVRPAQSGPVVSSLNVWQSAPPTFMGAATPQPSGVIFTSQQDCSNPIACTPPDPTPNTEGPCDPPSVPLGEWLRSCASPSWSHLGDTTSMVAIGSDCQPPAGESARTYTRSSTLTTAVSVTLSDGH